MCVRNRERVCCVERKERRRESVMKKSARESKRLRVSMRERGWEKEREREREDIVCSGKEKRFKLKK
jgi:hypothetical protein